MRGSKDHILTDPETLGSRREGLRQSHVCQVRETSGEG